MRSATNALRLNQNVFVSELMTLQVTDFEQEWQIHVPLKFR